jgi:periplasmic protein TonB
MAAPARRIEEEWWTSSPFGAFAPAQRRHSRQWLVSLLVSSTIYGAAVTAIVLFGTAPIVRVAQKVVDVTFVEKIAQPEPPPAPPPPPKPEAKPQPPAAAAAPVVPPHLTVRRLEKPPPTKPTVPPRRMPKEPPPEADPREDKGVAVLGNEGKQDPAGLEGGTMQGGVVGGVAGGAIELPDDAIPPRPKSSNAIPPYPQEARADGRTGVVVLEIVILADGSVDKVRVVRGDEPFASAAVNTVKTWKYEPARFKGQPISVYKTFQVTFKLT